VTDSDAGEQESVLVEGVEVDGPFGLPTFDSLDLTNFLSYKTARVEFGDLVALVGPNASGKSNAVAAIKLLRDIPAFGLPTAIARRGGFDQLRHRSHGHPNNPGLKLTFRVGEGDTSSYELALAAVKGKRYRVKREAASICLDDGSHWWFESDGVKVTWSSTEEGGQRTFNTPVAPGQSALSTGGLAAYVVYSALQRMQTVEINPARVAELQEPSSIREFEPDGSNTTSIFETLSPDERTELVDQLSAIVPGIVRVEPRNFADRQTVAFFQKTSTGNREFFAKQMSDGTLRSFGILLSMMSHSQPSLLVIEEPEVAIHLGALRTLVEILQTRAARSQVMITTHSADIIDSLPVEALRVVWTDSESSHISNVASHTKEAVRRGLMTPGELLRADSLDPEAGS
jgi:predicted ATPase